MKKELIDLAHKALLWELSILTESRGISLPASLRIDIPSVGVPCKVHLYWDGMREYSIEEARIKINEAKTLMDSTLDFAEKLNAKFADVIKMTKEEYKNLEELSK